MQLRLAADRKAAPVEKYIPGQAVDDLKARFAKLNQFIMSRGGWVVSIPGDATVIFEALPDSTIADELIGAGHDVMPAEPLDGERILPNAITQRLTLSSCCIFEELTEGSTKPVAQVRTHDGICRVLRFTFTLWRPSPLAQARPIS